MSIHPTPKVYDLFLTEFLSGKGGENKTYPYGIALEKNPETVKRGIFCPFHWKTNISSPFTLDNNATDLNRQDFKHTNTKD